MTLAVEAEWGDDMSKIKRFLPEYFRVATPMELIRKVEKGGEAKGPITYPLLTSFSSRLDTTSGSVIADCKFLAMKEVVRWERIPTRNPCDKPVIK